MPSSMLAVFVHGVPDTERIWSGVIARLRRNDVVTLSLPGFVGAAPTGFDATKEAYVAPRPGGVSSLPARAG